MLGITILTVLYVLTTALGTINTQSSFGIQSYNKVSLFLLFFSLNLSSCLYSYSSIMLNWIVWNTNSRFITTHQTHRSSIFYFEIIKYDENQV